MALMRAAEQVLRLAESLQIVLQASFIRGSLNVIADMLSRADTVLKTEWRLSLMTFSRASTLKKRCVNLDNDFAWKLKGVE